jgi:hypothetical protein
MKPIYVLFFLLIAMSATAQVDSTSGRPPDSLYYRNMFFSLHPRIYNRGYQLQHKEVSTLLTGVPEALQACHESRKKTKIGFYSLAGSVVCLGVSSIGFDNGNRTLMAGGLLLSFSSFINAIVFSTVGEFRLRRAIRIYNKAAIR